MIKSTEVNVLKMLLSRSKVCILVDSVPSVCGRLVREGRVRGRWVYGWRVFLKKLE